MSSGDEPGGVIAVHVTNRHLDLVPVLGAAAARLGLDAVVRRDRVETDAEAAEAKEASRWVVLARRGEAGDVRGALAAGGRWQEAGAEPGGCVPGPTTTPTCSPSCGDDGG